MPEVRSGLPGLSSPAVVSSPTARWVGRQWARWNYARQIEPVWLEENDLTIPVRDLPAPLEGLTIAHLTDFHDGPQLPAEYFHEVIERTNGRRPDLIALTGDYIHHGYKSVASAAETLGRLKAPLGVFAVLGNHDFSVRNALGLRRHRGLHQAIADALSNKGIRVLRNEGLLIGQGAVSFGLAGIDDLWSRECDPATALRDLPWDLPRVLLAHNPQTVEMLAGHRSDLMLSGHTHGGQVNWPGLGRVFLSKKSRRMAAGLHHHESVPVYVNKGVGFGWRFRFGVRPEIAFLRLTRMKQRED
ncbi:metallophosphoesterase [Zavarzinella formosa]|uniref:metallophosphoesterase n=1 Tax=Zavarzinella formosa TaxID=360055 RepID=UPI0002E6126C|nr:metallophosphoesterase [Zavarzinella formosa]